MIKYGGLVMSLSQLCIAYSTLHTQLSQLLPSRMDTASYEQTGVPGVNMSMLPSSGMDPHTVSSGRETSNEPFTSYRKLYILLNFYSFGPVIVMVTDVWYLY